MCNLPHITFNAIIDRYGELFLGKDYSVKIYSYIVINQDTLETKDIITFYNSVYLNQMKKYILIYKEHAKQVKAQIAISA